MRCWLALLLASLLAASRETVSQDDGVKLTNLTVTPSSHSLHVRWRSPAKHHDSLESYRVRVSLVKDATRKRVQWVPVNPDPQETISCLDPNTLYEVQVFSRFYKNSNITDGSSENVRVSTLPKAEGDFLNRLWEQRVSVLIGAILMAVVVLLIVPCICCCCYARKRKVLHLGKHDKDQKKDRTKTSKETSLPSAAELQKREKLLSKQSKARCLRETEDDDINRYSADPVQGFSFNMRSPCGTLTNPRNPVTQSPPPSYSHTTLRSASVPVEQAPKRPPMPIPYGDSDVDDDYQNDVFEPGTGGGLYANHVFRPPPPQPEVSVYGNMCY